MYKNSFNHNTRGRNSFRSRGSSGGRFAAGRNNRFSAGRGQRGRMGVRSFNPISLIEHPDIDLDLPDYVISHNFADFGISPTMLQNIASKGFKMPTPIQDQAIATILEGRDLIGISNTGTGKTAAFLIPLIDMVAKNRGKKVLIIVPTRELAVQINDEFRDFARNMNVYCALTIGGASIGKQIWELARNPGFVIGTPGRIQDLVRSKHLLLANFSCVVLDEVDRMVDIGFVRDIKNIVASLSPSRQSVFFSATINAEARHVLDSFVRNPVTVSVKKSESIKNIHQQVVMVSGSGGKLERLHELLVQKEFEKVLVFGRTKRGVQKLSDELTDRGFKAEAIHGNKRQSQRARTLDRFKHDQIKILIATDVASRGLDIPNVSHIINYDLPESKEAYIHRIGRTGRADKTGVALTFIEGSY